MARSRSGARLRVSLFRDFEQRIGDAEEPIEVPAHGGLDRNVEGMLGHFVDAAWAYRFGPPAQDLVVVTLESEGETGVISQAFRFPAGRPSTQEPAAALGLESEAEALEGGMVRLTIRSRRLAFGVSVATDGFDPDDDHFSVEPGGERSVLLRPHEPGREFAGAELTALNLDGRVRVGAPGSEG